MLQIFVLIPLIHVFVVGYSMVEMILFLDYKLDCYQLTKLQKYVIYFLKLNDNILVSQQNDNQNQLNNFIRFDQIDLQLLDDKQQRSCFANLVISQVFISTNTLQIIKDLFITFPQCTKLYFSINNHLYWLKVKQEYQILIKHIRNFKG